MKQRKINWNYFSKGEYALWFGSVLATVCAFFLFDRENPASLLASVLGATSLIFNAKGNPFGQVLMILFSLLYGAISFTFAYYGEMLTYLGMSMPMAVFSLITWLKHPYHGKKAEVEVNRISRKELCFLCVLVILVTGIFYFILKALHTANLIPSTVSVTTSFFAVYLTMRRSPYYALGYAANDVVLIVLWLAASIHDISYLSVAICFVAFLLNDVYGFINWRRMEKRQKQGRNI